LCKAIRTLGMNAESSVGLDARPRILLVEPDEEMRSAVRDLLEEEGFEVVTTQEFSEAMERTTGADFSLLLIDFHPSDVSKWVQLNALRRRSTSSAVGFMTAWSADDAFLTRQGVSFVLRKPFTVEDLFRSVAPHAKLGPVPEEQKSLVTEYFNALGRKDWMGLGELVTDNVVYELPGTDPRYSRSVAGRTEFCAFAKSTFESFQDAAFQVHAWVKLPAGVIARYTGSWKTQDGSRHELPGSIVCQFQGRRISRIGIRLDLQTLLEKAQTG
jgi:CheY-like chemotaxis protein